MWRAIVLIIVASDVSYLTGAASTLGCIARRSEFRGDDDGHYCVCNATYCDEAPDVVEPSDPTEYVLVTSSKSGLRFRVSSGHYERMDVDGGKAFSHDPGVISVNRTDVYQEVLGFGGAVTDAASINVLNLTDGATNNLLGSYFGLHGIDYSFIRTPMAGTDFSTRFYTYSSVENDTELEYFALQPEDYVYKIPVIKRAAELKGSELKLLTTAWTASPWMKTNYNWTNGGWLLPEYRQVWANYFVKYLEAYRRENLEFWGLTPQNEPVSHVYAGTPPFNGMAWTAEQESDWVANYLWPRLREKNFSHINVFSADENRLVFPNWLRSVFHNETIRDLFAGIALHFYYDDIIGPAVLDEMHQLFPEKALIYTEACNGVRAEAVLLGSWQRGEAYARSIIEDMSHWVAAWIDWNIALDTSGGPNWAGNYVDSPILVNGTADEFYKQPMFYVLGHFSKYVPPKSVRIGTISSNADGIESIAFRTPDASVALVILNRNDETREIVIDDPEKGMTKMSILGKSINTMRYW